MPASDDVLLPHLDAAYNLARWLVGNEADAEDVVQDAFVRALASLDQFRGGDRRAWLLTIVRNGCHSLYRRQRVRAATNFDEEHHSDEQATPSPERLAIDRERSDGLQRAIASLAPEFREVIVLRELEGLSYKEIAGIIAAPIGTVMSRLSRARGQLQAALTGDPGGRP
jgi:RNA polymerase sigma-70 factor (ECF subfamily)